MAGGAAAHGSPAHEAADAAGLRVFVALERLADAASAASPARDALRSERWTGRPVAREARLDAGADTHSIVACDLPASFALPTSPPPRHWYGTQLAPGRAAAPATAGALLCVMMSVAPRYDEEFNAWYSTEHIPALTRVPGVIAARRFGSPSGSPRYLALYHLDEPGVCQSRAWIEAAETPWTHRLRPHTMDRVRYLFGRRTELPAGPGT